MHRIISLCLITWVSTNVLLAQEVSHEGHDHTIKEGKQEEHHTHHHEIGVANSAVYFIKEKEFNYGLHLHYTYNFSNTKFGLGLGYERVFDEHKHNTIAIVGSYRPVGGLILSVAPGFAFEGKEQFHPKFAMHIEAAYEFEIKNFHLGPAFEFAYDTEDLHLSLGLHIGLGF